MLSESVKCFEVEVAMAKRVENRRPKSKVLEERERERERGQRLRPFKSTAEEQVRVSGERERKIRARCFSLKSNGRRSQRSLWKGRERQCPSGVNRKWRDNVK